jgi:hypothetical protein
MFKQVFNFPFSNFYPEQIWKLIFLCHVFIKSLLHIIHIWHYNILKNLIKKYLYFLFYIVSGNNKIQFNVHLRMDYNKKIFVIKKEKFMKYMLWAKLNDNRILSSCWCSGLSMFFVLKFGWNYFSIAGRRGADKQKKTVQKVFQHISVAKHQ